MDTRQGREGSRKGVRGQGKAPSHQRLQETMPHTPGSHPCANQRLGSWFTDVPSCHPLRVEGCTAPGAQQGSSKGINDQVSLTSHTRGLPARKKNLQTDVIRKWPNEGKGLASPTHQAWGIYLQTSYRDWQFPEYDKKCGYLESTFISHMILNKSNVCSNMGRV